MQCPQCYAVVPLGAQRCAYCNTEINSVTSATSSSPPSLPSSAALKTPASPLSIESSGPRKLRDKFAAQSNPSASAHRAPPSMASRAHAPAAPNTSTASGSPARSNESVIPPEPDTLISQGPLREFLDSGALLEKKFKLQAEIGRGGMGFVYRAVDQSLGREVAIKVLPPHYNDDHTVVGRFQREARAMASLDHPNIVTVYGIGYEHNLHYFSMKLLQGETLAHLNKRVELGQRAAPDPLQVIDLMIQACNGLEHAHAKQLLHRDIKPGNLMLSPSGVLSIMDFGIVKDLGDSDSLGLKTAHGKIFGTPEYMPPEQAMGKGNYSPASDLYALAVVGYELFCGELPYTADTPIGIIIQHIRSEIPSLKGKAADLSPTLNSILRRSLAKDPLERYQSASELRDVFSRLQREFNRPHIQMVDQRNGDFSGLDLLEDVITHNNINNDAFDLRPEASTPPAPTQSTSLSSSPPPSQAQFHTPELSAPPPQPYVHAPPTSLPPTSLPPTGLPPTSLPLPSAAPLPPSMSPVPPQVTLEMQSASPISASATPAEPPSINLERASKRSGHYKMPKFRRGK